MSIARDTILLKTLLCFTEVAKNGQINETALKNGMKQSNLSNIIKYLEEELGVKLFNRNYNGVSLTECGTNLFEISCNLDNILTQVNNFSTMTNKISGDIRFWTSEGIGSTYISPHLARFYSQYPEVHIEIKCSLESPRSIQEIDLGMVYQEPTLKDAVVIKTHEMVFQLYASKGYLRQHGYPQNTEDLICNHKLCTRSNYELWPEWKNIISSARHLAATTNSSSLLLELLKEDVGIAPIPTFVGDKEPSLMRLDKLDFKLKHQFWIIANKDTKDAPKVRALINYIIEATKNL